MVSSPDAFRFEVHTADAAPALVGGLFNPFAGPPEGPPDDGPPPPTTELTATLDGASEVPGPGDDDGSGMATVTITGTTLTFSFTVANIDMPTAAHIHEGAAGVSGGVVVDLLGNGTLTDNGDGTFNAEGMVEVDAAIASAISNSPGNYYVNVHNAAFGPGAVRGNLADIVQG